MPARFPPPLSARRTLAYGFATAALMLLVGFLLVRSLPSAAYGPRSDDGYYLHFAQVIGERGVSAFPELFEAWNDDNVSADWPLNKPSWQHPPPSRVGFVVASALWTRLFGVELLALSWLSLVSHLVWTAVNWFFARRRMGDAFALGFAALCGFSPLLLGLGRLALTDSYTCLWLTLSLWLFLELIEQPGRWRAELAFGVAFAIAILTKELSVLVALPLACAVLLERWLHGNELPLVRFALVLALPGLATVPLFVAAAGGFEPLITTTEIVLTSPQTNRYAIQSCSGPWYRYLIDYLCLSPFPTLLGLFACGALVDRVRGGQWPRPQVFFFVVGVGLLTEQAFLIKNVRYMVALEVPLRFLALAWLVELARALAPARRFVTVGAVVVALCFLDWRNFRQLWVKRAMGDPVTIALMLGRKMVPDGW